MDKADVLKDDTWLEEAAYDINYNQNSIFSVSLMIVGSAAYPSQVTKNFTFNITSGETIGYSDIFTESKMPELLKVIQGKMTEKENALDAEEKEHLNRLRKEETEYNPTPSQIGFDKLQEFHITDSGVVFIYNYGYRHVEKALEPEGQFLLTFAELKPFIKHGSLLETLIP